MRPGQRCKHCYAFWCEFGSVCRLLLVLLCGILVFPSVNAQTQVITTIAGNGTLGFGGDGGPATGAQLSLPWGVAADGAGNIYVADYTNHRVRKISPVGVITTIAGNGTSVYAGDGSVATATGIGNSYAVAVDGAGNIYSGSDGRIFRISSSGIISTVAGTGTMGYSGNGGPASAAKLSYAGGIAVDGAGNVYFTDANNFCLRKVNALGIISIVAGSATSGDSGDSGPATLAKTGHLEGLALDGAGNIYITDIDHSRVRKIDASGIITTAAGNGGSSYAGDGGLAIAAQIGTSYGVAADGAGNIYITDQANQYIRKVDASGIITTLAGTGTQGNSGDACPATAATMNGPFGIVAGSGGVLYFADHVNQTIRRIGPNHTPYFTSGSSRTMSVCKNIAAPVNSALAIVDSDAGGTETWLVISSPVNGTVTSFYTTVSNGGVTMPAGMAYIPVTGFTGNDSFKVKVTDCVSAADTITVFVAVVPPGAGVITGVSALCVGASATLSATATGGTWVSSNGYVAFSGSSGSPVSVTGMSAGVDTIRYVISNACGTYTPSRTITVNPRPNAGAISGPSSVCSAGTITLSNAVGGGIWGVTNPHAAVSLGGIVSGYSYGLDTVTYIVSNAWCSDTARHPISITALPSVGAISGLHNYLCKGSTLTLENTEPGTWSSSDIGTAKIDSVTGLVTGVNEGVLIITFTTSASNGCINRATFPLTVIPAATFTVTGTATRLRCFDGSDGSITLSVVGVGPFKNKWSTGDSSSTVNNLGAGSYFVEVKEVSTQCIINRTFNITAPDSIHIADTATKDICKSHIGSVGVYVTGGTRPYSYSWSNTYTGDKITGLPAGTYTVSVTDSNGCIKAVASIVGEDTCDEIEVFDVITPNGDGINDTWKINGLVNYPKNIVQVFDKFGDMVYEQVNYNNDWAGKATTGIPLPDGTYYYLIKLNAVAPGNESDVWKGALLIKR